MKKHLYKRISDPTTSATFRRESKRSGFTEIDNKFLSKTRKAINGPWKKRRYGLNWASQSGGGSPNASGPGPGVGMATASFIQQLDAEFGVLNEFLGQGQSGEAYFNSTSSKPHVYGTISYNEQDTDENKPMDNDKNSSDGTFDSLFSDDSNNDSDNQENDNRVSDDEEIDKQEDQKNYNLGHQGLIRKVKGAHLVYKRQQANGAYQEMWIYNINPNIRSGERVRRAILAGTDIPPNKLTSLDGSQSYDIWAVGNVQMLKIKNLPN